MISVLLEVVLGRDSSIFEVIEENSSFPANMHSHSKLFKVIYGIIRGMYPVTIHHLAIVSLKCIGFYHLQSADAL